MTTTDYNIDEMNIDELEILLKEVQFQEKDKNAGSGVAFKYSDYCLYIEHELKRKKDNT